MISIRVKLFGTLPQRFEGYDSVRGLTVRLHHGAHIRDLTAHLQLNPSETGMVVMAGRVVPPDKVLIDGARVRIFQVAHGG